MLSFFLFINRCFLSFADKLFAYLSITSAFIPGGISFKNSMTLRLLMSAVRSKQTVRFDSVLPDKTVRSSLS